MSNLSNLLGEKRGARIGGSWRRGNFVSLAMFALFVLVVYSSVASARYLPTRSDESRRERIKDLLRMLIEGQEQGANEADFQGHNPVRGASPFGFEDQSRPAGFQISKRSVPDEGGHSMS